MSKGPSILEAARMNSASYLEDQLEGPLGWSLIRHNSTLGVCQWESTDGYTYIGIAGTRKQRHDIIDSVKIFFGQTPDMRIQGVIEFVKEHCSDAVERDTLSLGGHSLGGLVASSVAAEFHLPALIQNAPGYFTQSPDPARCDRIVEIRTARDLVSDWGSSAANLITLHEPSTPTWKLSLLHAINRQNDLLSDQLPQSSYTSLYDAKNMMGIEHNPDIHPTGNTWKSIQASWKKLKNHHKRLLANIGVETEAERGEIPQLQFIKAKRNLKKR